MEQITTLTFADAVGRKKIADAVGVGLTAVSNGVVRNAFPASWFYACQKLAQSAGVECPPALFQQRPCSQSVDCADEKQAERGVESAAVGKSATGAAA